MSPSVEERTYPREHVAHGLVAGGVCNCVVELDVEVDIGLEVITRRCHGVMDCAQGCDVLVGPSSGCEFSKCRFEVVPELDEIVELLVTEEQSPLNGPREKVRGR